MGPRHRFLVPSGELKEITFVVSRVLHVCAVDLSKVFVLTDLSKVFVLTESGMVFLSHLCPFVTSQEVDFV